MMASTAIRTRVAAVFPSRDDAESAVNWLRSQGVPDSQISVMTRSDETVTSAAERRGAEHVAEDAGRDVARGAGIGLAAGAGVGALFGLAAAATPGVGPFIVGGAWLAEILGFTGGAAAAGAIVGGTTGAIAGALSKWGLDQADADYYAKELEQGGTFVAVDLAGTPVTETEARDAFRRYNGRFRTA
jgi:hypothetical protein